MMESLLNNFKLFFLIVQHQDDIKVDMDIHTMESDLCSLFGSVKDDGRSSPEPPGTLAFMYLSLFFCNS